MHIFKKIIMLFSLMLGGIVQASCPSGTPSNYTTSSRTDTDGSGRTITFTVCYPATMIVGNTYPIYVRMERSGAAGTTSNVALYSFLPAGFTFGAPVQTVNPAATIFNTTPAIVGGNNGTFAFTGLSLTDAPAGFVPVTPPATPGVYTYQPINDFVGLFGLPTITITVLASCPSITAQDLTGCSSGNLSGFVTGGTSPYLFSPTGTAIGGSVSLDTAGNYSFGGVTGSFQYLATDVAGCPSNVATVNVAGSPSLPTGSIVYNMSAGVPLTQSINVTGGTPPYTLVTTGAFPIVNGSVTFNSLTNEFTFTQTTPGASRMTAQIIDANGCASNTRNIYFYSCPGGGTVSAAMGNNNNQIGLIYAICYPDYVPLNSVFNITVSVVNVNPEGAVPTGPFRDFNPDPTQITFAPGLQYINTLSLSPEITFFSPTTASSLNQGGIGQINYTGVIASGVSADAVLQIQAIAQGQQTYTATNIFNPGNLLTPPVSIFVGPPCDLVANTATEALCLNSSITGDLGELVSGGIPPYIFGPTGSSIGGQVSINPSGIYTYTADIGFSGAGSFGYQVTDSNTGCAPVAGLVNTLISSPFANAAGFNGCVNSNVVGDLSGFVSQGFPPYTFIPGSGVPVGGVYTISPTGTFTFFSQAGFSGIGGFDYVVIDSVGCTGNGNVQINIASPSATSTEARSCVNGFTSGNLLPLVTGGFGAPYTFGPTGTPPACGNVAISGTGLYTFIPNAGFSGSCPFTYQVTDASGCAATGEVNVTVSSPIASSTQFIDCVNGNITGDLSGLVSSGFPPYIFGPIGATVGGSVSVNPSGVFSFTANTGFSGNGGFQYQVTDSNNCSQTGAVTVTVASPIAANTGARACVNGSVAGNLLPLVTGGFGAPYSFSPTGTPPACANVTISPTGLYNFTPNLGFSGSCPFAYQVTDASGCAATGAVTVDVSSPIAGNTGLNICLNNSVRGDLSGAVSSGFPPYTFGPTGATVGGTSTVSSTGLFSYTANNGFSGNGGFSYQVSDSNNCISTGSVAVFVDSLFANNFTATICADVLNGNLANLVNGGSGALTFSGPVSGLSCTGSSVTISPSGLYTYTGPVGFTGPCSFVYQVNDFLCSSTASVTITANTATVANNATISTCSGTPTSNSLANFLQGNPPPPLTFTTTLPAHGTLVLNSSTGAFTYIPNPGYIGVDSFDYQVTDSGTPACTSNPATVTIQVNPVPVATNATFNTCQNIPVSGSLVSLVSGGTPPFTFAQVGIASNGTVIIGSNGTFTFTPNSGFVGVGSFQYRATDVNGCPSNNATITVNVPCCPPVDPFFALVEQLYFNLPPLV